MYEYEYEEAFASVLMVLDILCAMIQNIWCQLSKLSYSYYETNLNILHIVNRVYISE